MGPRFHEGKILANWIRVVTPGWPDHARYFLVSTMHSCLLLSASLFFILPSVAVRSTIVVCLIISILTEIHYRECIITTIEQEFSKQSWDDIFDTVFRAWEWKMSRESKMTFTIGLNVGLLSAFLAVLLYETLLWLVGVSVLSVSASLALMWFAKTPHLQEIGELRLDQTRFPAVSQSFVHILRLAVG